MTYIRVNGELYPAQINGKVTDYGWDGRETKEIVAEMTYEEIKALLPDNTPWSIVMPEQQMVIDEDGNPVLDDEGNPTYETIEQEWDNAEFCLAGAITDFRDGTCAIKMGKTTDLEDAYALMIGGNI